jgi:SnoaL-like polyketide cyclase
VIEANKSVVRRLVAEVFNGGRLEVIEELYAPELAGAAPATHLGEWLGQAPTGRRFERVDEVWILRFRHGRIVHVWSLEDTLGRLQQLGLA